MKRAAAYIRVSDERQDEFSPDSQLKLIRDYCKRNEIELPEELIFYDDGISAKSTAKREQFNNMIALAKQKEKLFDVILVWKFSRFARNQEESIVYKSLLRKNGIDVVSVSEPIQDNPFGGLIERIIEWMDEYYLIRLSDEVRRGMTERATRGKPNCAPPYGYNMKDGEYIVNEEEAAIVRQIFDMFVNGSTVRQISDHLLKLEVKNHYGNPIDNRGVEYIINNPCYIGYVRWNPNGRSASKRNYNNPEDILKRSTHVPIVSEAVFKDAQSLMEARRRRGVKYTRESTSVNMYALKGLVKCNTCGSTLVYAPRNQGLQCHKYARGTCPVSHYVSLSILNKMVVDALRESARTLMFDIDTSSQQKKTASSQERVDYAKLIAAERLKIERARQAYQAGVDSLSDYKASKIRIEAEIEKLKKEQQKQNEKRTDVDLRAFAKTVEQTADLLESPDAPEELKNQALKAIVKKIVFFKPEKRVEIHYYI
ncbi:MAG: recombinase family protein [Clostridia bacterium]|nr:recombinase family protein [Clostridia bacterium]